MSDHKNKSTQDRGWNAMFAILEKELPVKEKKRPLILWFLLETVAMACLVFYVFYMMPGTAETSLETDNNSIVDHSIVQDYESETDASSPSNETKASFDVKQPNSESNAQEQNASKPNIVFNEINQQDFSENLKNNNSADSKSTQPVTIGKSIISKDEKLNTNDSELSTKVTINQNIELTTPRLTEISDQKTSPDKVEDLLDDKINQAVLQTTTPAAEMVQDQRTLLGPLFKIPSIIPAFLPIKNLSPAMTEPVIAMKNGNSFDPYVFATSNYQAQFNGIGYGIGAGMSYGNDNHTIYLESSYLKSTFNNGTSSEELAADASVVEIEQGDAGNANVESTFDLNVSNFSKLTTSTDELRIDLGIRKKLLNKFRIEVGVAYSRLLNASNKAFDIGFSAAISDPDRSFYKVNSSELYDSGAYSAYDIVPHFGFEYTLMPNVYLNCHYNYGLRNLIGSTTLDGLTSLSTNDEIYRRNVGIKIRYEF